LAISLLLPGAAIGASRNEKALLNSKARVVIKRQNVAYPRHSNRKAPLKNAANISLPSL
jgi:hypothetical protein